MIRYTRIKINQISNKYIMTWYDCLELKRKRKSFNSLSKAKQQEAELYTLNECSDNECTEHFERNLKREIESNNLFLRNIIDQYYQNREKDNLNIAYFQKIKYVIEHMFNICGNIKLNNLDIIQLWKNIIIPKTDKIKQYGIHHLKDLKKILSHFIKYCVANKFCSNELLTELINIKIIAYQKTYKINVLSIDQFESIISKIDKDKQPFYAIMFYAGLRPSEVLGLQVKDIDQEHNKLYVERALTKHKKHNNTTYSVHGLKHRNVKDYRVIPINQKLQSYLYSYIENIDNMLFNPSWRYEIDWKQAVAATFTPLEQKRLALRPYDLRHACVSRWLKNGIDPARVAQLAGHTVDVLLKTYAHVIDDRNDDYLEKMD